MSPQRYIYDAQAIPCEWEYRVPAVTIHDDWRATDVDVHSTQSAYLDNEAALLVESPNLLDRPSRTTCERRFKECMLEVLRLARTSSSSTVAPLALKVHGLRATARPI